MDLILVISVSGVCGGIIGLIAGKLMTEREMQAQMDQEVDSAWDEYADYEDEDGHS